MSTKTRFDLVIADLFVPWQPGTGSLYTREHFEAVRDHLEPGGIFCQWLPLYQLSEEELRVIAATFLDVFPNAALFRGDFYGSYPIAALVGFTGAAPKPEEIAEAARELAAAGVTDRWVTDPEGLWSLYVGPLAPFNGAWAKQSRNTDNWPVIEELAAATHAARRIRRELGSATRTETQEAVEALEAALDAFGAHDRVDAVDRRGVALPGEPRRLGAVQLLEPREATVERGREMCGGPLRLSAADGAVVEQHDAAASRAARWRTWRVLSAIGGEIV